MNRKQYKDVVSYFIYDFDIKQAERKVKTKSKVSSCFRSIKGSQIYLKIISALALKRKKCIISFEALTAAFAGNSDIILGYGSELLRSKIDLKYPKWKKH